MMAETPSITQSIEGKNNTQVGLQDNHKEYIHNIHEENTQNIHENHIQYIHEEHNNYGLSASDAMTMAVAMFREYYPKLRQEALEDIDQLVRERLQSIPAQNIVQPTARLVVPTIQKASITEEPEIREMYANLLASSMNSVMRNGVHPGFVEIINQLSPDEAKILEYFAKVKTIPTITLRYKKKDGGGVAIIKNFSIVGEMTKCENKYETNKYFDNLIRLGMLKASEPLSSLTNKALYEPLKNHLFILSRKNDSFVKASGYEECELIEGYMELTDFGKEFCNICISKTA